MRYTALLRAVNVGGRTVKMDRLCALFEEMKLRNVESFIASGNVIFESTNTAPSLESKIEKHLEKSLGWAVPTMVRSCGDIAAIAEYTPFPKLKPPAGKSGLYVGFLKGTPNAAGLARLTDLGGKSNDFHIHGRELYWYARDRMSVLKLPITAFEKALGVPATFRNVNTVRRLAEKFPG
jgi:uncharacterized protein (DUF1697 family)